METQITQTTATAPATKVLLDEKALRRELADAISNRAAAEGAARIAWSVADRAQKAMHEASRAVFRLKNEIDAASAAAIQRHARSISEALRGGSEVPEVTTTMPQVDSQALTAALARQNAIQQAQCTLKTEAEKAAGAVHAAQAAVQAAAVAVMDHDAKRIVGELIAARDIFWKLTEQASGFFLVDARRPGGPKFAAAPGHYPPRRAKSEN